MELFEALGRPVKGNLEPPTHYLDFDLPDKTSVKAELIFLALDRPDDIKKLRGTQATGFWLNETKEMPREIIDMCDLRHGRYPPKNQEGCRWHGMIGDYNAPDEDHYLYEWASGVQPEGWRFYHQPGGLIKTDKRDATGKAIYKPNPNAENLKNLPDNYYVKGSANKPEDWIDVNLCNQYGTVIGGKPVHPWYVDSIHTSPEIIEPDKGKPIHLGFDFGRTPACMLAQYDKVLSRWVFIDEFGAEDMGADRFAVELKLYLLREYEGFKLAMGYGDPSGSNKSQSTDDTPFKILNAAGLSVVPTVTNDPDIRRASLSQPGGRLCMDGKPALLVSPKCKMFRKGMRGGFCYKRKMISGERYHDEPDKNEYSHYVEAGEYLCQGGGEGIKAITPVDAVTEPITLDADWDVF